MSPDMISSITIFLSTVDRNRATKVLLALILSTSPVLATNYYVSPEGLDDSPGSFESPWTTIQHAANTLSAGDTVFVRAGNYEENVAINCSGNAELGHVVFTAYSDEIAWLDPGSFESWSHSYLTIEGFHIIPDGERAGIEVHGSGEQVIIRGNEITGQMAMNTAALRVGGQMRHFFIDGNIVHDNYTGNQEAIRVHMYTHDFEITNNQVYNNVNIGIDVVGRDMWGVPSRGVIRGNLVYDNSILAPWSSGIYIDGADSILIEYNISYGHDIGYQIGIEEADETAIGNVMRYNICYDNVQHGLSLGGYTGGEVSGSVIHNNVFHNNQHELTFSTNPGNNNVLVNNIVYSPSGNSINYLSVPDSTTIIDYNLYWTNYGTSPGDHSINAHPGFVNAGDHDYRLEENSPAIDAASPFLFHDMDFIGTVVPLDGNNDGIAYADMGAYEFVPPVGVDNRGLAQNKKVPSRYRLYPAYPNPFNQVTTVTIELPTTSNLTVEVFNMMGQIVGVLADGNADAGFHTLTFDANHLSSGIYFIRATIPGTKQSQKVILVK